MRWSTLTCCKIIFRQISNTLKMIRLQFKIIQEQAPNIKFTVYFVHRSHNGTFVDDVSPIGCDSCCSVRWISKRASFLKIGNSFLHSVLNLESLTKYIYGFHSGAHLARTTGTADRARCIVLFLVMMTYIANAAYGLQSRAIY